MKWFLILLAFAGSLFAAEYHPSLPAIGSLDGLGVNIHFTEPQPGELEMIKAAGFKWVRMDGSAQLDSSPGQVAQRDGPVARATRSAPRQARDFGQRCGMGGTGDPPVSLGNLPSETRATHRSSLPAR